ncbi:hypothetical protein NLG97_g4130 [Lecanicillium saksenae]|uniref:Uncharacterized protein n=1 Tax=Lecanicillium saksenae TaxID=468837 RepID=A0ACC1QXJ1_9HYPO|nr:hypothetical protein NLG97_g4130 [Lecanicillium saksenae]
MSLSKRAVAQSTPNPVLEVLCNLWHPATNPAGYLSLGVAENTLLHDRLSAHIRQSIQSLPNAAFQYCDGYQRLTRALARFLTRHLRPVAEVKPEHMVVVNGCTSGIENLALCFMDPGDYILLATPPGEDPLGPDCVKRYEERVLKIVGAKVIATASSEEKLKIVKDLGADHVINSNDDWVAKAKEITGGHGADSIYDGIGKDTFKQDLDLIAVGGSLVMLGNASGNIEPFDIRSTLGPKNVRLSRPILFGFIAERAALEKYAGELYEFIRSGKLKVLKHATYDLKDISKAHTDIESRKTIGKLLIKIN